MYVNGYCLGDSEGIIEKIFRVPIKNRTHDLRRLTITGIPGERGRWFDSY